MWLRQGVLPMLRQTLHGLELPARWLAEPDGERKLTNVLHLAELLQAASTHVEGEETLIRWLAGQIANPNAGGEDNVVRLESDADLVKVITIFKAKGLEYPLVYLPFACGFRAAKKNPQGFLTVPAEGDERRVIFTPTEEAVDAADRERQQEDLRLLYVALTRARHALCGRRRRVQGIERRALPLPSKRPWAICWVARHALAGNDIAALLHTVCGDAPSIALIPGEVPALTRLETRAGPSTLGEALSYSARFEVDWSIGSFSRLLRDLSKSPATPMQADPALQARA